MDGTDLERSLLDLPRGKVVDVVIDREGREQTLQLTVGVGKSAAIPVAAISQQLDVKSTTAEKTTEAPQVNINVVSAAEESVMNRAWDLLGLRLENLNEVGPCGDRQQSISRSSQARAIQWRSESCLGAFGERRFSVCE